MYLALKELKKEKARFAMIVAVIVLITYLVYFLSSLAFGLAQINRTSVDYWKAEGIVISKSANGNLYGSSIEKSVAESLEISDDDMINISTGNIFKEAIDVDLESVVFLGVEPESSLIPGLVEGRMIEDDFEVIVSNNIKDAIDLELDDVVTMSKTNREFTIVGFTEDSNFNTSPVVYATRNMVSQSMMIYDTSESLGDTQSRPTMNMPERVSALVIKEGMSIPSESILNQEDLEYVEINDFIKQIPGYQAQVLTFGLMIISLSLIVSVIMGIFMYILTMQKKSVFAVLKIQGYQNKYIVQSIIIQVLILLAVGISIGFGLTYITLYFLPSAVPVALYYPLILMVTLFIMLTSLFGALFSARSVLKIDPLEAL